MRCFSESIFSTLASISWPTERTSEGLFDATPGDVGHMQQAIDAADVDEGSVVHQVAHRAVDDVAFLDLGITALLRRALLIFQNDAAIDHQIFFGDVELGDAAANLLPDQLLHLGGIAHSAARRRHEGADADIDAESAFDHVGHGADDGGLLGKGALQRAPILRPSDSGAR